MDSALSNLVLQKCEGATVMNNNLGNHVKTITSNKPGYIIQIIIYAALVFLMFTIYGSSSEDTGFAVFGIAFFGICGVLQTVAMVVTRIEVYENGIYIKKALRKAAIPYEAMECSYRGKLKYTFFTIANYLDFRYSIGGRIKTIRVQTNEIPKKALMNLTVDFEEQIKFISN